MARFRVLGSVDVVADDGTVVPPAGPRQGALLAALVARAGQVVPSDTLVELMWGRDSLPGRPDSALHSQVSRLRDRLRAAGADRVETRPAGYALAVTSDDVDALRFDTLCRAASSAPPDEAVALLDEALALWRGEAYVGVEDDTARNEAIRLREAKHAATEARAAALLAAGRPAEVVADLEAYVADHPLRESARATLMRALYLTGRHADALAHFDDHRRRLADELGLEPSPELAHLHQQVLRHEIPAQRADADVPESSVLSRMVVRFLHAPRGRRVAWATAGSGPPLVVLLGWVSSLEVVSSGRDPRSTLLERLAHSLQVITYDRAGTGLSRATAPDGSLEYAVEELEAVVTELGTPVSVLAMSQAGPVALELAARRPDLVTALALFGTYASGPTTFGDAEVQRAMVTLLRAHWGLGAWTLAGLYRPALSSDGAAHLAQVLYDSAPAGVAADYLAEVYDLDVSASLPRVTCPALVMHYRGDRVIPFAGGEHLATHLPDATFLPLDGSYHLPDVVDLDRVERAVVELASSSSRTPS